MRYLVMLIIIGGLIAGYIMLQQNRQERESRYRVMQCKPYIEKFVTIGHAAQAASPPDEAPFFELLFFLHKSESAGINLDEMISNTCDELGIPGNAAGLVKTSIHANYELAKKFKLFDDLESVMKLEHGEAATIKLSGWQDEKVAVGQIISPLLAPEAAQSLPNLQLMPESVRDSQNEKPTEFTLKTATTFERSQIITRESLDRVKAMRPATK